MRFMDRIATVGYTGALVAVWLGLWGSVSWANLASGVAVAIGVTLLVNRSESHRWETTRPLATAYLVVWFAWKLVEASALVTWDILTPRDRARQGVIEVQLRTHSDRVSTFVANMISLTPGSLTLEVEHDEQRLFVHVLQLHDRDEVVAGIHRLEDLVIAAFGPTAELSERTAE